MPTPIDQFNYQLPPESIAQTAIEPRDHSRLLLLDRATGQRVHKRFFEILDELNKGDLLVVNDSKVFKARLRGMVGSAPIEVFLLRPEGGGVWQVLVKPGKVVGIGSRIEFPREFSLVKLLTAKVLEKGSVARIRFSGSDEEVFAYAQEYGEVPLPPYIEQPSDESRYQTVYAKQTGSVAAPTAGFHFTPELLDRIREKGIEIAMVTLHVGLGTFRPIKTETIEEHAMHSEWVELTPEAAALINKAKQEGRRVIAVGTTTVRVLEGVAEQAKVEGRSSKVEGWRGELNIFIKPGFKFKIIDGLITNFHLPKSTLLVLVSAFAGRENVLAAYEEAIKEGYRFYSFGDAMFIR